MQYQVFEKGFAVLTATFPSMNFNARLYWEMLKDLDGKYFIPAVEGFIKNTAEIFPGTNIIAKLRKAVDDLKEQTIRDNTLKIEQEDKFKRMERMKKEGSPMPEDCREQFEKLGIKLKRPQKTGATI